MGVSGDTGLSRTCASFCGGESQKRTMIVEGKGICFRTRVRLPSGPSMKKQGNPPRMASFLAFFMLGYDENIASADEKCALAVHDATRNATRTTQNQHSLPRISPIDISDAPYLDIFRPGVFLKRRFRLTEQLIERNLFLKAIDHRQNISRILREHGAGGIRHGRAENPLVIG